MKLSLFLILVQCFSFAAVYCDDIIPTSEDVSIIAMGLSGAGVFSSIENLMNGQAKKTQSEIPVVTEYSWPVVLPKGTNCTIRIAVSSGQIEGKTADYDSEVLSSVKEYIKSDSGLRGGFPSIVLIVAQFDDTRPDGKNSQFVKLLKNIEMLKNELGYSSKKSSNLIFLLTHLMSKTKSEARKPDPVINKFIRVIKNNSDFIEPIVVTVGENRPEDYGLVRSGWNINLPNRQNYPKNVVNEMLRILETEGDYVGYHIVKEAFKDPNKYAIPVPKIKTFFSNGNGAEFSQTIIDSNYDVDEDSEINRELKSAYNSLNEDISSHSATLPLVQLTFQREGITTREELPKTVSETVKLFQKLPSDTATLALVEKSFNLKQPSYYYPLIVGHGYDVLEDTAVEKSPFILDRMQPTNTGYSFPDIYIFSYKENEELVENFDFIESYDEFKEKRLAQLNIPLNSVNLSAFSGVVRSSFTNTKPKPDAFVSLTVIQQIRNFELILNSSSSIEDEFLNHVNDLAPFNQSNPESEKEWKAFFGNYGTHIVTNAYGGGYMEAIVSGDALKTNINQKTVLVDIKNKLTAFEDLPDPQELELSYNFFGGEPDVKMTNNMNNLTEEERKTLFDTWKMSLNIEPRIMDIDIKLVPISHVVYSVNQTTGQKIQTALDRLLLGNLIHSPRKRNRAAVSTNTPSVKFTTTPKTATTITTTEVEETTANNNLTLTNTTTEETNTIIATTVNETKETNIESTISEATTSGPTDVPEKKIPGCKQTKHVDYTRNIIGHGYHILRDIILSTSPFRRTMEKINGLNLPVGVTVKNMTKPCSFVLFREIKNCSDYVKDRINRIYTILPNNLKSEDIDLNQYKGNIKPGYNILQEISTNGPFSIYKEIRYFNLTADFAKFNLSKEFVTDANNLKSYQDNIGNATTCGVIYKEWVQFFETYGTHVVREGYGGTWTNTIMVGVTRNEFRLKHSGKNNICKEYSNSQNYTSQPGVAISSLIFATLKEAVSPFQDQLSINHVLLNEYENVMTALLKNQSCMK